MLSRLVLPIAALIGAASLASADNFAVIVVGSSSYMNYRHHADVGHAYRVRHHQEHPPIPLGPDEASEPNTGVVACKVVQFERRRYARQRREPPAALK